MSAAVNEAKEEALARVLDAAEEWARWLDGKAADLERHGQLGRRAGAIYRGEASLLLADILWWRPLRERDPETDEWVEA